MGGKQDTRNLLLLLREPTFAALADETVRDYIDWDQLAERRTPPGLDAEETWELLGRIRRLGATVFPIPTLDKGPFWYNLNREGAECLRFVESHCRADSVLHQAMRQRRGDRFLVRSRIREVVATCRLDGVDISSTRARRLLEERRAPRTATERLVVNSYEMLGELESLAADSFSPDLMRALYCRLTRGVELAEIERGARRYNLAGTRNSEELTIACAQDVLDEICDYANVASGDPSESFAIKSYLVFSAICYWQPLPDMNETVARHMLRLFAVKRGFPVLGYLPSSATMLKWFEGCLRPGAVRFSELKRRPVVPGSLDGTEDILTYLQLTKEAIGELLDYIARARWQDGELMAALDRQQQLNHRQRSVLTRALANPTAEFSIRGHQTAHRVVYQSARTDLLGLMEHGYLQRVTRGKAFIFLPSPNLPEIVRAAPPE